jgi:threonine dehydrogenase-like Zn-dependent dehydrogenase
MIGKLTMTLTTMPKPEIRAKAEAGTMKALVYRGPGKKTLEVHAKPDISAKTDAIVKITKTTICGTDLHILKGDLPTCEPGRILGHEGVGIVEKVGPAVTAFKPVVNVDRTGSVPNRNGSGQVLRMSDMGGEADVAHKIPEDRF